MSVTIRLTKIGKKGEEKFRIVAKESRSKNRGKALEVLGFFDKATNTKTLNRNRLSYWEKNGAIVTQAVQNLLS